MTTPGGQRVHDVAPDGPHRDPRPTVPWFPRFFLLECAAGVLVMAALSVLALVVDAPLLEIADPSVTPDPSKAPWYFVGLQELLHYYPPVISGVAVPAAAVVLLLVVPYTRPDLTHRPLWTGEANEPRRAALMAGGLVIALGLMTLTADHAPWLLLVPTALFGALAVAPGLIQRPRGPMARLARWPAVHWIGAWIAVEAVLLSLVGALFRGPGWAWVWPWLEGVY